MKAFTTDDEEEIRSCLKQLRDTDGETGFMHESLMRKMQLISHVLGLLGQTRCLAS